MRTNLCVCIPSILFTHIQPYFLITLSTMCLCPYSFTRLNVSFVYVSKSVSCFNGTS